MEEIIDIIVFNIGSLNQPIIICSKHTITFIINRVIFNPQITHQAMNQRPHRHFFNFDNISKHLLCSICQEVFDNPSRMRCGHTFCYQCMFNWRKISKTCPVCKTKFNKWQPEKDLVAAHIIDDLNVKCSFGTCGWTGLYSGLKKHNRFCTFREKKQFDEVSGEQVVKVLDEVEQREVQQVQNQHKKGKKKVKQNSDNIDLPQFPPSSSSEQSINMQPLQPNRRRVSNSNSKIVSKSSQIAQNGSQVQQSSKSDDYLQANLVNMIKNDRCQFRKKNDKSKHMRQEDANVDDEEKKERYLSQQLRDISFDDGEQMRLYPKSDEEEDCIRKRSHNRSKEQSDDLKQQDYFSLLDDNRQQPQNLYIYKRHLQEQERIKKIKAQRSARPKWKIAHPNSQSSKQQSSDSSKMSNPFDEPIPQRPKKRPKVKEVIILDSSEDSHLDVQKQSGEISQKLQKQPIYILKSVITQNPDSVRDSPQHESLNKKKEAQIQKQMKELTENQAKKDYLQRKQKRKMSKEQIFEY